MQRQWNKQKKNAINSKFAVARCFRFTAEGLDLSRFRPVTHGGPGSPDYSVQAFSDSRTGEPKRISACGHLWARQKGAYAT